MRMSERAQRAEPFYVMEVAKAALALGRSLTDSDKPMVYLNIGEPDFSAPERVREAAQRAIRDGATQYTQATGMPALREANPKWMHEVHVLQEWLDEARALHARQLEQCRSGCPAHAVDAQSRSH